MNLSQIKSKSKIVIVSLVLIVLVVLIIGIVTTPDNKTQDELPVASITPQQFIPAVEDREDLPLTVEVIKQQLIQNATDANGDKTVYSNSNYVVTYVPVLDIFFVQILQDPAQEIREEAQSWFLQKGLSQNDLCQLPLRFTLFDVNLKQTNPNFNFLPDTCS